MSSSSSTTNSSPAPEPAVVSAATPPPPRCPCPPRSRSVALLDEQPLFVRLGRHGDGASHPLRRRGASARAPALSGGADARAAGASTRAEGLMGPPTLLEAGVPVHEVTARLGHVDLRTAARYATPQPDRVDEIAEVLDRRHQARDHGFLPRVDHQNSPGR